MSIPIQQLLIHHVQEDAIKQLAQLWKLKPGAGLGKEELAVFVAKAYNDERIIAQEAQLSPAQGILLRTLSIMSLEMDEHNAIPFYVAEERAKAIVGGPKQARKELRLLADTGLLFTVRFSWHRGEEVVVPPEVSRALLHKQVQAIVKETKISAVQGDVQPTANAGLALYHDLLTIASACVHEQVEVSQKKVIYKRTAQKIAKQLRSQEALFPNQSQDGLPAHFSFMVDFLDHYGVLDLDKYVWVYEEGLRSLLRTYYLRWCEMLHTWLLRRFPRLHINPSLFINTAMSRLGLEGWDSADAVLRAIGEHMAEWQVPYTDQERRQIAIDIPVALGIMMLGKDSSGQEVFQWTAFGKQYWRRLAAPEKDNAAELQQLMTDELFVQPNLEIIVPENILPAIRWKVEALATLKRSDAVLTYELSEAKVKQALDAGWNLASMWAFLGQHSKTPLTDNVYQTLRGWVGNYGKARLWDVMVLEVDDGQLAARIVEDTQLSGLVLARFSDRHFAISRSYETLFREKLQQYGYPVAFRVEDPDIAEDDDDDDDDDFFGIRRDREEWKQEDVYAANLDVLHPSFGSEWTRIDEVLAQSDKQAGNWQEELDELFGIEDEDWDYDDDDDDEDEYDDPDYDDDDDEGYGGDDDDEDGEEEKR